MTTLSKVKIEKLKTLSCNEILHPGSCTANFVYQFHRCLISNAKYYAPIVALPVLAKFRNFSRDVLKDSLRYYLECVLTGTFVGWSAEILVCLFRNILGKFQTYTLVFLPGLIAGLNVYMSSARVQRLFMLTILQSMVESILMQRKNLFTKAIANSVFLQTLLFMSSSSIILQAKQKGLYKGFWLLTPDKSPMSCQLDEEQINSEAITPETSRSACTHGEENCTSYLIKGVRSYFAFGITLDFLKTFLADVPEGTVGFWRKLFTKFKNFKLNSAALLTSYIGIYRFTNCYLNQKSNTNLSKNHIIAGFLSGVCYIFMPKLTWLSYALVIATQILWQHFKELNSEKSKDSQFWLYLLQLPYMKIYFPFCLAYLIHNYCLDLNEINTLGQIVIDNTTDFYAERFRSIIKASK